MLNCGSVGFRICRLAGVIKRHIDFDLSVISDGQITGNNGWLISYLSEHGDSAIYQKDVEQTFGIRRSTASVMLSLMESKGYITREGDPRDARLKRLVLTEKAVAFHKKAVECKSKTENLLLEGFSEEERAILSDYIDRLCSNLEKQSMEEIK